MVLKKSRNLAIGAFGESRIVDFCTQRGDEILDRNWRVREGEIDIVSMDSEGVIHFIEVKTRSSIAFGHPFEAVTPAKLLRMQRLAMGWLVTHDCFGCEYQIDIASVLTHQDGSYTIEYRGGVL
jgi:putative endonuclease